MRLLLIPMVLFSALFGRDVVNALVTLFMAFPPFVCADTLAWPDSPTVGQVSVSTFGPVLQVPDEVRLRDSGGKQAVKVSLDQPAPSSLSVRVWSKGGTATSGRDYKAIDEVLHFSPGATSAILEVEVLADLLPEAHETIELVFSDAQGISLPKVPRGRLVIDASGLELNEIKLLSDSGVPVSYAKLWMRDKEVTIGVAPLSRPDGPWHVCLWDNATGILRGLISGIPADIPTSAKPPTFLATPEGIDVEYHHGNILFLARLSRENGAELSSASFPIPLGAREVVLLGGGRVLHTYSPQGGTGSWAARTYEIGGPVEGVPFPDPPPMINGVEPTFISDGKYLVSSWGARPFSSHGPSYLGVFDAVTLASVWQMEMQDFRFNVPTAIRGDLLICGTNDRTVAIDLQTREMIWQQEREAQPGTVGDSFWFGQGYNPLIYDLVTGAEVSSPGFVGEAFNSTDQVELAGPGGVVMRDYEFFPEAGEIDPGQRFRLQVVSDRRTRPGVQLLNQAMEQSHDGAYFAMRTVEKTNVPVQVSIYHINVGRMGDAKLTLDLAPVALPEDGSLIGIPYKVEPTSGPPYPSTNHIGIKIETPGQPPLVGEEALQLVSGIPVAPAHLGTVIASTPTSPAPPGYSHPKLFGMRAWDGKIVAFTGESAPGPLPLCHRVDVLDASTGNLLRRIVDPAPSPNRMFGINAIAQGDKVLVLSRMAGGEVGTAEIFSIASGQLLAVLNYTGKVPGFGDVVVSNANYFAIGTPGQDLGKPAGSQVEVYRWLDYQRVFRKTAGGNAQLGYDMAFNGDTLYASAPGRSRPGNPFDPSKGKVVGFKIGAKGKVLAPKGTSGVIAAGASSLLVGNFDQLQAYDWSTMHKRWSVPYPYYMEGWRGGAISVGEGLLALNDLRDWIMFSEADGRLVATTRFYTEMDNSAYGNLFGTGIMAGNAFTLADGTITKWPLKALGDFSSWRWFDGLTLENAGPTEDRDRNGIVDFDDYVTSRLNPAVPFANAVYEGEGNKVRVDSAVLPPPDVLVLVEVELEQGIWSTIAWREGHYGWSGPGYPAASGPLLVDLPAGVVDRPPLRLRYLPNASLGKYWGGTTWPPGNQLQSIGSSGHSAAVPDQDNDGLPDWLERQLGLQGDAAGLGIVSGPQGVGVSYLRPLGGIADFDVESSEDLRTWQSAKDDEGVEISVAPEDGEYERVILRGKSGASQRYFRVKY